VRIIRYTWKRLEPGHYKLIRVVPGRAPVPSQYEIAPVNGKWQARSVVGGRVVKDGPTFTPESHGWFATKAEAQAAAIEADGLGTEGSDGDARCWLSGAAPKRQRRKQSAGKATEQQAAATHEKRNRVALGYTRTSAARSLRVSQGRINDTVRGTPAGRWDSRDR
jgi:hypothetical protein